MAYSTKDLATVEEHVAEGEKHVARQKELVLKVAADPKLKSIAEQLLSEMEVALSAHRRQRDDILDQMRSGNGYF
jgi:hypothetical protein